ncbi:hypothetical protein BJ508DRAFT_380229 [Ascobolus immersus RN42]|uniref:Uncharacterized protein n=1 Tax=Ascobolus immersus RN42 TaxID=1160509 RepID=A0A3N4HQ61_ASCIM|nr:hypothetical protein BJ508DRAFT_380229 [Ascobolus immersus RN42]
MAGSKKNIVKPSGRKPGQKQNKKKDGKPELMEIEMAGGDILVGEASSDEVMDDGESVLEDVMEVETTSTTLVEATEVGTMSINSEVVTEVEKASGNDSKVMEPGKASDSNVFAFGQASLTDMEPFEFGKVIRNTETTKLETTDKFGASVGYKLIEVEEYIPDGGMKKKSAKDIPKKLVSKKASNESKIKKKTSAGKAAKVFQTMLNSFRSGKRCISAHHEYLRKSALRYVRYHSIMRDSLLWKLAKSEIANQELLREANMLRQESSKLRNQVAKLQTESWDLQAVLATERRNLRLLKAEKLKTNQYVINRPNVKARMLKTLGYSRNV